jgi:integrase
MGEKAKQPRARGSGSLRQRGANAWELRYAGNTQTFHGSRDDANKALAKLITRVEEGRTVRSRGRTVATLANAWWEARSPGWSPFVAKDTRRWLDRTFLPALGNIPLSRVRTEHIDAFYATRRRQGLAESTIRRNHSMVNSMFNQGVDWEWIGRNPAAKTHRPDLDEAVVHPPPPAVVVSLLDHIRNRDADMFAFLVLAADTGARLGQLGPLRWSDLDETAGTLSITRRLLPSGEILPLSKKKGRARVVPLAAGTVRTLAAHKLKRKEVALQFGVRLGKQAFMFSDDPACRTPWKLDTFKHRYVRLRREPAAGPGAADVNFHQLRHYVATQLIAAGVDPRTVADRLGHSRTSTTVDMYAAPVSEMGRTAADLLERILDEAKHKSG